MFLIPHNGSTIGRIYVRLGRVQALTAEANMESTKSKEDKEEIVQLRNEIYAWKQKYYDCRRKVVAVAQ